MKKIILYWNVTFNIIKINISFSFVIFIFFYFFNNSCNATEYINVSLTGSKVITVPVSKEDVGYKVLKDNQSNYYVLGKSSGEIILLKYSSNGTLLWTKNFYGFENGEDIPKSMVFDSYGNINIFGTSFTSTTNTDFILIKCNSDGVQLWCRKIYNPYPSQSEPGNIVLDDFDNIYFCGTSTNSSGNYDYVTFKYDKNGVKIWSVVYDGGMGNDKAFDVVVDNYDNIYVTGNSSGNGTMFDIATIKYSNSGVQEWVRRYNCSLNKSDCGRFITLRYDSNNFCYPIIMGESDSLANGVQRKNVIVFEYNSSGDMIWFYRNKNYDVPAIDSGYYCKSFTVDSLQNIYIGSSAYISAYQMSEYKTIKISNSGIQQWYLENAWQPGVITSVDILNNQFIITSGWYTFNSSGYLVFFRNTLSGNKAGMHDYHGSSNYSYSTFSTVLDSTNKIVMAGSQKPSSDNDIFIMKWDTAGTTSWAKSYSSNTQRYDIPASIVLDNDGNIHVAGISYGSARGSDAVIYKYEPDLTLFWQITYKGIGFNNNQPVIIKLDSMQNTYLGASIKDSSGYYKFLLLKYNSMALIRAKKIDFSGYYEAELKFMKISKGNIFISGNLKNQSGFNYFVLLKLNLNCDTIWSRTANVTGINNTEVKSMELDDSSNVYLVCKGYNMPGENNYDFITIKYSPDGTLMWVKVYDSPFHLQDEPNCLTIDSLKNVFVTGLSKNAGTGTDFLTLKYNPEGVLLWNSRYNSSGLLGFDTAKVVIAGDTNSLYVGGNIKSGSNSGNDILLIKYNQYGDTIWTKRYNRAGNYDDLLKTMIKGHRGDIFISGKSYVSNNIFDGIFIRYDKSGNLKWSTSYNLGNTGSKDPVSIIQKDSIKLYTILANYISPFSSENHLLSLSQSYYFVGLNKISTNIPEAYKLEQNYPNPFNPVTKIKFDIVMDSRFRGNDKVLLKVFDILGKEVTTLVNEQLAPGTYEVEWNASQFSSGIYFYRLEAGDFKEVKRMALIK